MPLANIKGKAMFIWLSLGKPDPAILSAIVAGAWLGWDDPRHLTVSLVPDGTSIAGHDSDLLDNLDGQMPRAVWRQELMRAFQAWSEVANVSVGLVADDGSPLGAPGRVQHDGRFGDIRIAAQRMSPEALSISVPADALVGGTWSGDILFNSDVVFDGERADLFSVALHEVGHALGLGHSEDPNSVMYSHAGRTYAGLNSADIAAIQNLYGLRSPDANDALLPNDTLATATVIRVNDDFDGRFPFLAFGDITTASDMDYFTFHALSDYQGSLTVRVVSAGISQLAFRLSVLDAAGNPVDSVVADAGGVAVVHVEDVSPSDRYFVQVQSLDGQPFREFTLASRQMRVVWGAPLEQLEGWIAELKPVAIFSFGQGADDFRVESRASNKRGGAPDNNGVRPLKSEIVAGGPAEYRATSDCARFAQELAAKGYPVRVGTNAGGYLCEECVYSLEHVKTHRASPASVLFCHVPQLGGDINGHPVDGPYIERFVKDVLEVWYAAYEKGAPPLDDKAREKEAAVEQVRAFVDRYFSTWSKQDMAGYGDCFASQACIQFIDSDGRVVTRNKAQFVAEQTEYHARSRVRAEEKPVNVDIHIEGRLARAVVFWKLAAGPRTEFGYDHFTLVNDKGRWRILNLVFYASQRAD